MRTNERINKRIRKGRIGRIRNLALAFAVIFIAAAYYLSDSNGLLDISDSIPFRRNVSDSIPEPEITVGNDADIRTRKVNISDADLSNELMLVNSEYKIDENFTADLSAAYHVVPLSTSDIEMNGTALEAVSKLFEEAEKKGYKDFFVNSAFRSFQKQKELYDNSEDKSYVQEPGASEHQTGYALDIAYNGLSGEMFDKSPQGKWLMENAHKYGFILRYPKSKTDITKISYESWHYRYIGIPHSYYCYENNMCLEEYISFLANGGSYSISIDKANYTVYYATDNGGFIDVPADKSCKVLPDNTGGYVVVAMG